MGPRAEVDPTAVVREYYSAFNAGDLERWSATLHDDVEFWADAQTIRGRDATRAYIGAALRTFPGIQATPTFRAVQDGCVVVEMGYANPDPEEHPWRLEGRVCEIFDVRDGRIGGFRTYHVPTPEDRTDVAVMTGRVESYKLADEHTTLRKVAALVEQGAPQQRLFDEVNRGVASIIGADGAALLRSDGEDAVLVAAWTREDVPLPIGDRRPLNPPMLEALRSGRPLRFNSLDVPAPFVEEGRELGMRSAICVPISVTGRSWGMVVASSTAAEPMAPDTEERITRFAELVAIALAHAEARSELERLAEEQAGLRRVAELVARAAPPQEVEAAVVREASDLLAGAATAVHELGGEPSDAAHPGRPGDAQATAQITVNSRLWGVLTATARSLPDGAEDRLARFADLLGAAITNAENRALLQASRARVVATADETRRRMQRDLHDGAQQRLVQTILTLEMAREALRDAESEAAALLAEALGHAGRATEALTDLVRGILPTALTRGGLPTGIASLLEGVPIPVEARVEVPRLSASAETTAYFVIAEALTNVVKHAGATRAEIDVLVDGRTLLIRVSDDGRGGADASLGSGLTGLRDRVEAAEGTLEVSSPPGRGTLLAAAIPLPELP